MSRGVKDLRDLICVSRLTVRHSDEELSFSDEDLDGQLSHSFEQLTVGSSSDSRQSSAQSTRHLPVAETPDSGFGTNGHTQDTETSTSGELGLVSAANPHPPDAFKPTNATRKRRRKKKKALETVPQKHEMPKAPPLPPLNPDTSSRPSTSSSEGSVSRADVVLSASRRSISKPSDNPYKDGNYDRLLTFMDATLVSEWLEQANKCVTDLAIWIHTDENFVQFAHFFITDFPDIQKQEIFRLEYSILLDSLQFAFATGRDTGKVKHRDLTWFLGAVFREYPDRLLSSHGPQLFLDYLDLLTSERQSSYKKLLSDVKCSTRIKQYAQWILAVRSFALVSVWFAVVNFYRRLLSGKGIADSKALPVPFSTIGRLDANKQRIYQAIRNGYIDVVSYLLKSNKVDKHMRDSHNKTLVFCAVTYNQPRVLQFLLKQMKLTDLVNTAADNGNTPLHAAANSGKAGVAKVLLSTPGLSVNPTNSQCDNATPLHLAVMHGHSEVVELLLQAKADKMAKMGDATPVDIARDFGHTDIETLFANNS